MYFTENLFVEVWDSHINLTFGQKPHSQSRSKFINYLHSRNMLAPATTPTSPPTKLADQNFLIFSVRDEK